MILLPLSFPRHPHAFPLSILLEIQREHHQHHHRPCDSYPNPAVAPAGTMSYYNPHGHGGAPPSSPCPSPSPPPPPPQGYPMDPYAERGMEHHHHHQYGPPPPQPMYASPYGQPPPPPMYQQPYGQPVYASPYGQPPPPPAMYPPPYAQPPPPPPRKTGASFAEGWYVPVQGLPQSVAAASWTHASDRVVDHKPKKRRLPPGLGQGAHQRGDQPPR
ncbi:hypothetical protein ZEAMMB73_Zm00001d048161 [Zea mays]|uniref:Uncharacterized protein n=1 Tax=Zea mays TaxID=4577 RepID=A0A1D6PI69_MAIZE|nr:hypothetical protein ZEAMMB73_Zm00001d048161 [Zea mays]